MLQKHQKIWSCIIKNKNLEHGIIQIKCINKLNPQKFINLDTRIHSLKLNIQKKGKFLRSYIYIFFLWNIYVEQKNHSWYYNSIKETEKTRLTSFLPWRVSSRTILKKCGMVVLKIERSLSLLAEGTIALTEPCWLWQVSFTSK